MPAPVVIVSSGGLAITEVANGTPMTPSVAAGAVKAFGTAVTIVGSGGLPVRLVNADLTPYVA